MAIIETKADQLMSLVFKRKKITTKEAAKELAVDESFLRTIAFALEKHNLIKLKASTFSVTLFDITEEV